MTPLANPRLIYGNTNKSDALDAVNLALLRARDGLIVSRTQFVNQVIDYLLEKNCVLLSEWCGHEPQAI